MYVKRIQLTNYGPIGLLDVRCQVDDDRPKPIILVGPNGAGKSVVLSTIVNGFISAQSIVYPDTPEVDRGKVYKMRSPNYIKSDHPWYFSRVDYEANLHVAELMLREEKHSHADVPEGINGTDAMSLWNNMQSHDHASYHHNLVKDAVRSVFKENCILYFPSNRFEDPAWLNAENLNARARYMELPHIEGYTSRRVINLSPLHDNQNWLFEVAFDRTAFEISTVQLDPNIFPDRNNVLSGILSSLPLFRGYSGEATAKYEAVLRVVQVVLGRSKPVRLGIGRRTGRVVSVIEGDQTVVPNIFQLSSGEVSLLNVFLSILRDFDLCEKQWSMVDEVRGIVVVDEIDLHLHVAHQYEILPALIKMFPRVQFILTTHSPLFVLGLKNTLGAEGFDLYGLPSGQQIGPEEFEEFGEAYRAFVSTRKYVNDLSGAVTRSHKPLVILDGAIDLDYMKCAAKLLGFQDEMERIDIRDGGGEGNLRNAWKVLTKSDVVRQPVVLLHDCESGVSERDVNNVFQRKLHLIEANPVKRGVENMFSRETLARAMGYRSEFIDVETAHTKKTRGVDEHVPEKWTVNGDEKRGLCDWLCENGTVDDFRSFEMTFEQLRNIPGVLEPRKGRR